MVGSLAGQRRGRGSESGPIRRAGPGRGGAFPTSGRRGVANVPVLDHEPADAVRSISLSEPASARGERKPDPSADGRGCGMGPVSAILVLSAGREFRGIGRLPSGPLRRIAFSFETRSHESDDLPHRRRGHRDLPGDRGPPAPARLRADRRGFPRPGAVGLHPFQTDPGVGLLIELVAPDSPASKLARAASNTGGLNHLCDATDDIKAAYRLLRDEGRLILQESVPAGSLRRPADRLAFRRGVGPHRTGRASRPRRPGGRHPLSDQPTGSATAPFGAR